MKCWLASVSAGAFPIARAGPAAANTCLNGRSEDVAMGLSILHGGTVEWSLNGWGNFNRNVPQEKSGLGWLPGYGYPYLSTVSAIDAFACRTDDDLKL